MVSPRFASRAGPEVEGRSPDRPRLVGRPALQGVIVRECLHNLTRTGHEIFAEVESKFTVLADRPHQEPMPIAPSRNNSGETGSTFRGSLIVSEILLELHGYGQAGSSSRAGGPRSSPPPPWRSRGGALWQVGKKPAAGEASRLGSKRGRPEAVTPSATSSRRPPWPQAGT